MKYTVRHARTVILETDVEASDGDHALARVAELQMNCEGAIVLAVKVSDDTRVVNVVDDESIWEVADFPLSALEFEEDE